MKKMFIILRVALRALRRNKMRTILTMLGMIIGVGAVIATVSLGNGAKSQVEASIASLGRNVILIFAGSVTRGGARGGWNNAGTLMVEDAAAIQREVSDVSVTSPEVRSASQVASANDNWSTTIQGESEGYLDIRQWPLSQGSMFTAADVHSAAKVAILGKTVADTLFPAGDAVGQAMRIKGVPFVIEGVLIPKGLSVQGSDQDDVVIVPYTTAMKRLLGTTIIRTITVTTGTTEGMANAEREITDLLRQRHRITPGHDDDFTVRTQEEIAQTANSASDAIRMLLLIIACVSLLIGGIGIMNIMLVSVTERTREIGIRLAVGAHGSDILLQFLTEAVVLSMVGGGLGIVIGILSSWFVAHMNNWPTMTSVTSVVVAFLFSALVGIFFGFYPAYKASKLDPIVALRYE